MSEIGSQRDLLQDRTMEVETPEHVSIEYPLAGLGSRFAALLADLLIVGVLITFFLILFYVLILFVGSSEFLSWIPALSFFCSMATFWCYFFFLEAFRDGQTIGKKWMSIRVVMDGGYPITLEAALIRNLIRIVDLLFGGLVGGFFMLLTARAKRLGDLAASTVVVRELPVEFPEAVEMPAAAALPRLDDAAFLALEKYIDRREALEAGILARISRDLAGRLYPLEPSRGGESPDGYLVRFYGEERLRRRAAQRGERLGSAAAASLVRAKRARWEEFRALAGGVQRKGLASLGEDGVGEFAARYRELTADLARARTYGGSAGTIYALERVVGSGHNLFYRPARQSLRRVLHWLAKGFPRLVRKRWAPIALAAVLLYAPGIVGFVLLVTRPENERLLVPGEMVARAEEAQGRRARGEGYIDVPLSHEYLSAHIVSRNIQVSFLCFALGITAGIGTAVILITNGLSIGTVLAAFSNRGALDVIGLFVLPHGVIELTAICIAGGAGLWMGSALLLPGEKTRLAALAERAREAVALIAGVAMLLVVAGLIEGFISPSKIPTPGKLAVAAIAAGGLALYLTRGGREGPTVEENRSARGGPPR